MGINMRYTVIVPRVGGGVPICQPSRARRGLHLQVVSVNRCNRHIPGTNLDGRLGEVV